MRLAGAGVAREERRRVWLEVVVGSKEDIYLDL